MITNIGSNLSQVGFGRERTSTGGDRTIKIYEGTREAVEGFALSLPLDVQWTTDDSESPKVKLRVSFPYREDGNVSPEPPVDTWELPGNAIQNDIYEHPNAVALGATILSAIKQAVALASSPESSASYGEAAGLVTEAAGNQSEEALDLFDLILRGTTQYQTTQYVLRHTRTVGARTSFSLAFSNVEKIYTTAQLSSEDQIPSGLIFSIDNIPTPTAQTGYVWGWLKQAPSVRQVAAGKFEVVNEWWLAQWSTFLYATV